MAVYCEARTDIDVLDEIGDAKRILLVGCAMCANMSYAIHKELPMYKFTLTGVKALCTADEMHRMARLLAQEGLQVDSWLPSFPTGLCTLAEGARNKLSNKCRDIDTIITLSCETGTKNVEDISGSKKVLGAMNARGLVTAVVKRKMGKVFLDKQKVYIKKFAFE